MALGAAVSVLAGRAASALLYDTSPRDGLVLLGAVDVLVGVAAAASLAPALRTTRVDPRQAIGVE